MKKGTANARMFSHILILLLCVIIAVVATFSWYSRSTTQSLGTAGELTYSQSGNITGNGCIAQTFAGTYSEGDISYSSTPVADTDSITSEPGACNYFKTVITDQNSNAPKSVLSVYLENFTYSSSMGSTIHIGLLQPEKTYKQFTSTTSGSNKVIESLCLEDNIVITSGGTVTVYWFVQIDSSYTGSGSIGLGNLHIVYN